MTTSADRWMSALLDRHLAPFSRTEFLKGARALSARYVEGRGSLAVRPPLDSAAKRAAFAVLYGPIHCATTRAVVCGLGLDRRTVGRLVDLGCGTGAASAGWAHALSPPPAIVGIDRSGWALGEARWTWRICGLHGRTIRGDLVGEALRCVDRSRRAAAATAFLLAWSANEVPAARRPALLQALLALGRLGASVLVIEPIATTAVPWWDDWAPAFAAQGGRADAWRIRNPLPAAIRGLDRDAGFDRPFLTARSLCLAGGPPDARVLPSAPDD